MNQRLIRASLLAVLLTTGCAVGYQARGSLGDVPGELQGKAFPGSAGGGRFVLAERTGRVQCDGQMSPPDTSPFPGSCAGETGRGVVRCSDGRNIPVRWTAITCRSFEGSGEDSAGNRLVFRVDRSK